MILSAIAALSTNRAIGREGKLPWHLPEDLKYFRETTRKKPVIMGRKTFESIGRPLPDRENIVLTRQKNWRADGVRAFENLEAALRDCQSRFTDSQEVFIIGGAEIYTQSLPLLNRLYLTLIEEAFEGDAFFPSVDLENDFKIISETERPGPPPFRFIVAERKSR